MDLLRDDDLLLVLTTVADEADATRLAHEAVELGLAACVTRLPGARSVYRFEGKLHDDVELLLLIKTRRARYAALEAWLSDAHPYDVPEILALPASDVAAPYARWLLEQTRGGG